MKWKMNHEDKDNKQDNDVQEASEAEAEKEEAEDDDLFYFESDHLALRGNVDYSEVLKTMFVLEAQRNIALKDYNKVTELQQIYLKDPLSYIEHCKNSTLNIPPIDHIADIPKIDWSKYPTNVPEQFMRQINSTRIQNVPKEQEIENNKNSWTPEEQRKLEELLVKYPQEEVERKRIIKIANELGTRTKEQVASRLQKYFQKLYRAGLPIPGRLPRCGRKYSERKKIRKHHQHGNYHRKYLKPTTFFPDTIIPVVMDELEHAPGPSTSSILPNEVNVVSNKEELPVTSNYLLTNNYHMERKSKMISSEIDIEMELLKLVKAEKTIENQGALHQHYGYKCDYCDEDPIQGSRWHCTVCVNDSIDFCTDCILSQFYTDNAHDLQHKFLVIRNEREVTNGFWSETDSESDSKSNDGSDSDDSRSCLSSVTDSIHDNDNINKISEECPNDIFDSNHRNGDDYET